MKKVQKTLTGAMAAVMATGMATPVMAAPTNVDAIYKAAYNATMKALQTKTQEAVNEARIAIKALPATLESAIGEFSKQLDTVQHPILVNIVTAIKTAQTTPNQANVNAAKASLVKGLPQTWLNSYSSAVDAVQQDLMKKVVAAVKLAETSRKAEDVEAAKKLVADLATATSEAIKTVATGLKTRVEAVKLYDLVITKATVSDNGIEVEFKALEEALRDATLEVIDNKGKAVEVEVKSVLLEGETTWKFLFTKSLSDRAEGTWKINGFVVDQDEVNFVSDVNDYKTDVKDMTTAKQIQYLFDLLNDSEYVTGLVDKLVNHNQYVKEITEAIDEEEIATVKDIQKVIDSANKNVGTEVKAADLIEIAEDGTLNEFKALFNKVNFERVNSEWIPEYKEAIAKLDLKATIAKAQEAIDEINKEVALNVFEEDENTLDAEAVKDNLTNTKDVLNIAKIEKQISYVETYIVAKATDTTEVKNKAAKLKELNELLAVANVVAADTKVSLTSALKKFETVVNNKKILVYKTDVNEDLMTEYVKEDRTGLFEAEEVKVLLNKVKTAEESKAIVAIGNAALAFSKIDKPTDSDKTKVVDAYKRLAVVTAKNDKATKFDISAINTKVIEDYIDDAKGYDKNDTVVTVIEDVNVANSSTVRNTLKDIEVDSDEEEVLAVLENEKLGLKNVDEDNSKAYQEAIVRFRELLAVDADGEPVISDAKLRGKLVDLVTVINAEVVLSESEDAKEIADALTTIAITTKDYTGKVDGEDVYFLDLYANQKLDVAERILYAEENGAKESIVESMVHVMTMLSDMNDKPSITEVRAILSEVSEEFADLDDANEEMKYAEAFTKARKTEVVDKVTVLVDFNDFTEVRELLAEVMAK